MSLAPECRDKCALAHVVNNKLKVILAACDLLSEGTTDDPLALARLQRIRDAAKALADEFNKPLSPGTGA